MTGAQGPSGPQGPQGAQGALSGVHVVSSDEPATGFQSVSCPTGEVATGGGYITNGTVNVDAPLVDGDTPVGWQANFFGTEPGLVYVICAPAAP
ncbi:hypothetical protein [Micromonospora tulbaghiae]|uniref:hypothetical protein n=1 Tax=Micromonospora tulbaghiae TaxID=479978 RepID=UPI001CB6CD60|nr:hypothetical protein [Micromonospora tulbaghiae]